MIGVDDIAAASEGVVARLEAGADDAGGRPSRLPGWTVGHVLSHIALNAEAFVRVAADRRAGRTGTMYPDGLAGRTAAIDAGSTRSMAELVADVRSASAAFVDAWHDPVPVGPCQSWDGLAPFSSEEIPLRRLREVEVHSVDTGLDGFDRRGWTEAYVRADLQRQWDDVARRTREPLLIVDETGTAWRSRDAATPVSVDRRSMLAWLLDREQVEGLPPLLPWGEPEGWMD